jgi:hypothetical protein
MGLVQFLMPTRPSMLFTIYCPQVVTCLAGATSVHCALCLVDLLVGQGEEENLLYYVNSLN